MSIKHWIEKDKKRVRAVIKGKITTEEIIQAINKSLHDPDFENGFDILSDHTGIEKAITTDQVMKTSSHIQNFKDRFKGSRWAVVTEKEVSYGMMRMLSTYLEKASLSMRVFKTYEDADNWLKGKK
ncbi:MAG: STAS/SEC14 domain-containing protein [bacterium]|nr:MAG: STAS/SEC14 domain-containing protein [bacterium]